MAKYIADSIADAGLVKGATGTILTVCTAEPTTRTEAVTTFALAEEVLTAGHGNGDFTLGNGTVNGRKTDITAQSNITIDTSGDATHVAICDATDVLYVTTCTLQTLTAGGTVTVPTWSHTIADVTP